MNVNKKTNKILIFVLLDNSELIIIKNENRGECFIYQQFRSYTIIA